MRKTTIFAIILLITTSASGQFFAPHQKPNLGLQVNWGHSLSKGLVGCWLFNEGSGGKVFDLSGNNKTGILVNGPIWIPGKYGSVLDFDGTDDSISIASAGDDFFNLARFTVSIWVRRNAALADFSGIVVNGQDASNNKGWILASNVSDEVFLATWDTAWRFTAGYTLPINEYHHLVGVHDGSTNYLYVDGRYFASTAAEGVSYSDVQGAAIGVYPIDDEASDEYWPGQLDVPMIWNRALSPSEIAQLYREPFCFMQPSWNYMLYGGISVTPSGQIIFINN